jgi:TonB family protein
LGTRGSFDPVQASSDGATVISDGRATGRCETVYQCVRVRVYCSFLRHSGSLLDAMLRLLLSLLCGICLLEHAAGQGGSAVDFPSVPISTQDPRGFFDAALSSENIRDPRSKPWHLKADYQLYDQRGKPTEQGTFEYWWVSSNVFRSTWTRPDATHSDWDTEDGRFFFESSGEAINRFEYKLEDALLPPLPIPGDLDPKRSWLVREDVSMAAGKAACIMIVPRMPFEGRVLKVPRGMFPTYCFDLNLPVLRASYSEGAIGMEFNQIVKIHEHYAPREIVLLEGKRKMLSATVESITDVSPGDPALTPAQDSIAERHTELPEVDIANTSGMLVKKVVPRYPSDAKLQTGLQKSPALVLLRVTIGLDGTVHDMHVVEAPSVSMVAAALNAVSEWRFKPFTVNGKLTEVRGTIRVFFFP